MTKPDFRKMGQEVETTLRDIGVYVDVEDMRWMDPQAQMQHEDELDDTMDGPEDDRTKGAKKSSYIMMVTGYIGKVAFSKRVQDPDQYDMDAEFGAMKAQMNRERFEEKRQEILRSLDNL